MSFTSKNRPVNLQQFFPGSSKEQGAGNRQ
jgi:hypothetical protein